MRKASILVGLTLFALATTASAQEATPAASTATSSPASAPAPASAEVPPAGEAPAPVATTPAAVASTTPAAAPAATPRRRIEIGLSFLPMGLGTFTYSPGGAPKSVDAAFAYGASLTASYEVLPGLLLGVAPQYTFNVKDKTTSEAAKELDLLARVAYAYRPVETITVYAEVLPGYSTIYPPQGLKATGFVLAFGAGAAMDLGDRYFANVGMGYQIGFQNRPENGLSFQTRTRYVRVALGGGVRF